MNKEQQKDFNIRCAEFMGFTEIKTGAELKKTNSHRSYKTAWDHDIFVKIPLDSGFSHCGDNIKFDPYNDANDRNKVIEKMGISTYHYTGSGEWMTCRMYEHVSYVQKSMEAAQIACIAAVLEINND